MWFSEINQLKPFNTKFKTKTLLASTVTSKTQPYFQKTIENYDMVELPTWVNNKLLNNLKENQMKTSELPVFPEMVYSRGLTDDTNKVTKCIKVTRSFFLENVAPNFLSPRPKTIKNKNNIHKNKWKNRKNTRKKKKAK